MRALEPEVASAIASNTREAFVRTGNTVWLTHLKGQEALLRRLLARWVSELDIEPHLYFDHRGEIVGIGPDVPLGAEARVFIRAKDFPP